VFALAAAIVIVVIWPTLTSKPIDNSALQRAQESAGNSAAAFANAEAKLAASRAVEPVDDSDRIIASRESTTSRQAPAAPTLTGRVTSRDGAPIEGAEIVARVEQWGSVSAFSNESGTYRIQCREPGAVEVQCSKVGFREQYRDVELSRDREIRQDFELDANPTMFISFDVEAEAPSANSSTVGEKTLVSQFIVIATAKPLDTTIPIAREIAAPDVPIISGGRYWPNSAAPMEAFAKPLASAPASPAGLLEVTIPFPVYVSAILGDRILASVRLDAPREELTFTIRRDALKATQGSLTARIVDATTGKPVPKTSALLIGNKSRQRAGAVADESGVVSIEGIQSGLWRLLLSPPLGRDGMSQFESRAFWVSIGAGECKKLGDVNISANCVIRGRVVDEKGVGKQFWLNWWPENPATLAGSAMFSERQINTREDGTFVIERLARGKYWIGTVPGRFNAMRVEHADVFTLVDLTERTSADVTLILPKGTRVWLTSGFNRSDLGIRKVTVVSSTGTQLWSSLVRGSRALNEGNILVPGDYELIVDTFDSPVRKTKFTVGTQPMRLNVDR
jgi:hypothetical protein